MERGNPSQEQYTVTLFDYNHLAHVIVLWEMLKLSVTVQFLLCFILNLRGIYKHKPPEAYIWRDDLTESFLCYEFGGLIFGGAYFRNFTVLYRPFFNYYDCFFHLRIWLAA